MVRFISLLIALVLGWALQVRAESDLDYILAVKNYGEYQEMQRRGMKDEQAIHQFEKFFLRTAFLDPVFSSQNKLMADDEDDDEDTNGLSQMKSDYDTMYSELMAERLAEQLAKQDVMNLKKIVKKRRASSE